MPRLTAPPPLVAKLQPTITQSPQDEQQRSRFRDRTQHRRGWYKLKRWTDLRWLVLKRDLFTCRMCGRPSRHPKASDMTCDHIVPASDLTDAQFWDETNLQTLCTNPCHIKHKQAQERAYRT